MHVLRDQYGYPVRRGYVFYHESDLEGLDGIHIECKVHARLDVQAWMSQAEIGAEEHEDGLPVVFFRLASKAERGRPWMIIMHFSDWQDMGGEEFENDHRASFRQGVYKALEGKEAVRFWRGGKELVVQSLEKWNDIYATWKLPFTEGDDVSDD